MAINRFVAAIGLGIKKEQGRHFQNINDVIEFQRKERYNQIQRARSILYSQTGKEPSWSECCSYANELHNNEIRKIQEEESVRTLVKRNKHR